MKINKIVLKKEIRHLRKTISEKCLDCTCYRPKEIINCVIKTCPLWEERPTEARGLYTIIKRLKEKNLQFSNGEPKRFL